MSLPSERLIVARARAAARRATIYAAFMQERARLERANAELAHMDQEIHVALQVNVSFYILHI